MNIRIMSTNDYDDVYNLWINTPGMGLNNLDDSKEGIEKYIERNPTTCFVAEDGENIIGVILCGHDGRRGFIYHTAVHMNYRNQGIARELVKNAIQALEAEGINKVALVVFEGNKIGNAFWDNLGFSDRLDLVYRNKGIRELDRIDT